MLIKSLSLLNFRNLKKTLIELNDGITIFYGDNAQGKTNILEAIYICATGRSQRTRIDSQLVCFDETEAHLQLFAKKGNRLDRIDVHIKSEGKKGIAVNGIPLKKSGDLFGTVHVIIFSPEDLNLVKNGPSERRRFMDMELCQLSNVYYYDLQQYYKVLKQRNNLLKKIKGNNRMKETLFVWDEQLVSCGKRLIRSRSGFIVRLNDIASKKHELLTGTKETLLLDYKPNVGEEDFEKKLVRHIDRDIMTGITSVGPHKDDLYFSVNGIDVKAFGSQGQQRTAALSAKLAEIELVKISTGHTPVLLLDDVLSELDEKRQMFLLGSINKIQTVITCTGIEDTIKKYAIESDIFHIKDGIVDEILRKKESFDKKTGV